MYDYDDYGSVVIAPRNDTVLSQTVVSAEAYNEQCDRPE